jgi:hypothetical protein
MITIYVSDTEAYLSPPVEGVEVDRNDVWKTMCELKSMGYSVSLEVLGNEGEGQCVS